MANREKTYGNFPGTVKPVSPPRPPKSKIFISHHNSDAQALRQLKLRLESVGIECFLAHEDIKAGEHDYLDRIETELKGCDIFLYVGSAKANESAPCQQEIGMAKALNKTIITAMTKDNPPKGFIERIQAIRYKTIDNYFCDQVYNKLREILPLPTLIENYLKNLNCEGFSLSPVSNRIQLKHTTWDDYSFKTQFNIQVKGVDVGSVKIGFVGQTVSELTRDKLSNEFTDLSLPFFSNVNIDATQIVFNKHQIEILRRLLNDVEYLTEESKEKVSNESVYKDSLFRGR